MQAKLIDAERFFNELQIREGAGSVLDGRSSPLRANGLGDSQFIYICAESQIHADAVSEFEEQRQYLINLAGLAVAYVQNECAKQNNNDLMWDTDLWGSVYASLPMFSKPQFTRHQENIWMAPNDDLATHIAARMTGMVVAGHDLSPLIKHLGTIRASLSSLTVSEFSIGSITVRLQCRSVAGQSRIEGYLKGTFIKFTRAGQMSSIDGSVGHEQNGLNMNVTDGEMLFDYGALRLNGELKSQFDDFLSSKQITAIEDASSFFYMGGHQLLSDSDPRTVAARKEFIEKVRAAQKSEPWPGQLQSRGRDSLFGFAFYKHAAVRIKSIQMDCNVPMVSGGGSKALHFGPDPNKLIVGYRVINNSKVGEEGDNGLWVVSKYPPQPTLLASDGEIGFMVTRHLQNLKWSVIWYYVDAKDYPFR